MAATHRDEGVAGSRIMRTNGIGYRYERFLAGGGAAGIARPLLLPLMLMRE
jgi:hypothetical protein